MRIWNIKYAYLEHKNVFLEHKIQNVFLKHTKCVSGTQNMYV